MHLARRTKYSDVRPEGSFTPPPKIVLEVETTWPWLDRWVLVAAPPFRMVVPRSQPFAPERDMTEAMEHTIGKLRPFPSTSLLVTTPSEPLSVVRALSVAERPMMECYT